MATAATVNVTPPTAGGFGLKDLSNESASRASKVLQENHEKHHIYFNNQGYHDHIVHHVFAIYALGASPKEIQKAFDVNAGYQRPSEPIDNKLVSQLDDPATFKKHLGDELHYPDYLEFFRKEISKKGYKDVIKEYLLAGDDRADDLLGRCYAGFLHPIIHMGYGVEFEQPAIIAETLAQTAIHPSWEGEMLFEAEKKAKEIGNPKKSAFDLLDEAVGNKKLRESARWEDPNKIRDGILVRAKEEMMNIVGQYKVNEEDLAVKTAEMIDLAAYFTLAAQRPNKQIKMDFFLMHSINCSVFFPSFLAADWLTPAHKARLLEFKTRLDLVLFISRGSPKLSVEEIREYVPKMKGEDATWQGLFKRMCVLNDDGHASKFVRALAQGEKTCGPFEGKGSLGGKFRVGGEDWLKMANMVVDSVEVPGPLWVRSTGFDEAWAPFGERNKAQL